MQTTNYRVHLKSGASFDIVEETDAKTYNEYWLKILSEENGKSIGTNVWHMFLGKGNKCYFINLNEIVCFEKLDK